MVSCLTTAGKTAKTGGPQNSRFAGKAPLVEGMHASRSRITFKQAFYTLLAVGAISAAAPKKTFGQGTDSQQATSSSTITPGNAPKGLSPEKLKNATLEDIIQAKILELEKQGIPNGSEYLARLARDHPDSLSALFSDEEKKVILTKTVKKTLEIPYLQIAVNALVGIYLVNLFFRICAHFRRSWEEYKWYRDN